MKGWNTKGAEGGGQGSMLLPECGESTVVCTSQSGGTNEEDVLIDNHTLITRMLEEG